MIYMQSMRSISIESVSILTLIRKNNNQFAQTIRISWGIVFYMYHMVIAEDCLE